MTIDFACSSCGRTLRVPEEYQGRKVKCPGCGNIQAAIAAAIQSDMANPSTFQRRKPLVRAPRQRSTPSRLREPAKPPRRLEEVRLAIEFRKSAKSSVMPLVFGKSIC